VGPSLVEMLADPDEVQPSPCQHGVIVVHHACYCHHLQGPRKCPQWRAQLPYEECKLFTPRDSTHGQQAKP
jgi:hypothetical protein